jgi:hypothetical protein
MKVQRPRFADAVVVASAGARLQGVEAGPVGGHRGGVVAARDREPERKRASHPTGSTGWERTQNTPYGRYRGVLEGAQGTHVRFPRAPELHRPAANMGPSASKRRSFSRDRAIAGRNLAHRLGPCRATCSVFWLIIPVRGLHLALDFGQPCTSFVCMRSTPTGGGRQPQDSRAAFQTN